MLHPHMDDEVMPAIAMPGYDIVACCPYTMCSLHVHGQLSRIKLGSVIYSCA